MNAIRYLFPVILLVMTMSGFSCLPQNRDVLFQVSNMNAIFQGVYDGKMAFGELKKHGDFGIGTFDGIDGEMFGSRGKFYQIRADGRVYPLVDSVRTPFAIVTFFESDKSVSLHNTLDYKQFQQQLDNLLPTKEIFYAIRIEGPFKYIKARSIPKQEKPYPPFDEVVKSQVVFEFNDVEGTLVGFRCPAYIEGINYSGYHLHFITKDRKAGGHLLDCQVENPKIEIDYTSEFHMALPESGQSITK